MQRLWNVGITIVMPAHAVLVDAPTEAFRYQACASHVE